MAELLEAVNNVNADLAKINELAPELAETEIPETLDRFADQMKDTNLNMDKFTIDQDEEGTYKLLHDGKEINLDEGIQRAESLGDVKGMFKALGFPDSALESSEMGAVIRDFKNYWERQPGFKKLNELALLEIQGEELSKTVDTPTNEKELLDIVQSNKDLVEKIEKKLKSLKKNKTTGKWAKRALVGGAVIGLGTGLYTEIRNHQDYINGCWLINIKSGEKCKLHVLSCSNKLTEKECDPYTKCGIDFTKPCFDKNTCVLRDAQNVCIKRIGECAGNCSKYCNKKLIKTPPNTKLICLNLTFWSAAEDYLATTFTTPLFNWLYIGLAIAAIVVLIILLK